MIIQANAHIGLVCRDLEKSIRFYKEILGMREKFTLYYGDMISGILCGWKKSRRIELII